MGSSATSVCSQGSGGAITDWAAFERWALRAEAARVEEDIAAQLRAADEAPEQPYAGPGWAALELLIAFIGALIGRVPHEVASALARASGRASRALHQHGSTLEGRTAARRELERALVALRDAIRRARSNDAPHTAAA